METAVDCFDPYEYGPEDETEEQDEGDGMVRRRKDFLRPPVADRCECQQKENFQFCNCKMGMKPQGVSAALYWDKINTENR